MDARLAARRVATCIELTAEIDELEREITTRVQTIAPALMALVGFGALNAAKVVAHTAAATRFRSSAAFARYNGTAPLPVWSSNHQRHRLSRAGNRQLNSAIHIAAIVQIRLHPGATALYQRRISQGDGTMEALFESSNDEWVCHLGGAVVSGAHCTWPVGPERSHTS